MSNQRRKGAEIIQFPSALWILAERQKRIERVISRLLSQMPEEQVDRALKLLGKLSQPQSLGKQPE